MKIRPLFLTVVLFAFLSGCASTPKSIIAAPDFNMRNQSTKKVGVLLAGSFIFELQVGGKKALNKEWSDQAAPILTKVSIDQLKTAGYSVKPIKLDDLSFKYIATFNNIPRETISRYVYAARPIDTIEKEKFDAFLKAEDLDALVLVRGIDHVSSGGRQAMRVVAGLLGAGTSSGIAHVEMAMLDKSRTLIFYSHKYEDGKDLRTEEGTAHLFNEIIEDMKTLNSSK